MTPRQTNTNKDNVALILYRLDELKEQMERNYQEQIKANAHSVEAHSNNTLAIARLESKVTNLEKDFLAHFDDTRKKPVYSSDGYIKVLLGIVSFLGTILAAYIAFKVK